MRNSTVEFGLRCSSDGSDLTLRRADAEMINGVRVIQARARKDLSYGAYPDLAAHRFFEM